MKTKSVIVLSLISGIASSYTQPIFSSEGETNQDKQSPQESSTFSGVSCYTTQDDRISIPYEGNNLENENEVYPCRLIFSTEFLDGEMEYRMVVKKSCKN